MSCRVKLEVWKVGKRKGLAKSNYIIVRVLGC